MANPFEETARDGGQLVQPGLGRPGYGGPQDWGAEAKGTGPYADTSRDTGGDGAHLRRKTTFAPRTRPKPKVQTGGDGTLAGGGIKNYLTQLLTGKHFGETGNRQKLINAMKLGLIDERQYKLMGGYDARIEMGMTPIQTLQASGIYNTAKGVMSPQDFKGQIGPIESTFLNTIGSTGYGFDKDQYSGIMGLSPESLTTDPTGPYGSNYPSKISQNLDKYSAPAYDFANGGLTYLLYGGLV